MPVVKRIDAEMQFNIGQIERAMKEAQEKAELLCFGEAFLQGFDSLCWNDEKDRYTAMEQSSEAITHLRKLTARYGLSLLTGYIEKEQNRLYSSCIVPAGGGMELYDFLEACDVLEESAYDTKELAGANHNLGKRMIALESAFTGDYLYYEMIL